MQWTLGKRFVSEDEIIKEQGLFLDYDEIARKGAMTAEEKNISKWYGIYTSRQSGNHMARIVIPGGVLTSSQARRISKISEDYAQGKLAITTRQCIQLHWLKTPSLADMVRGLAEDSLSPFHGCGDVTRNVTGCPLAETCKFKRFNVLPYVKETARVLTESRDLDNLPRKFKITFSGCGAGCAQPYINCIGIVSVTRKGADGQEENGFKVVIGGGMGWAPFIGKDLFSFVPPEKIVKLNRAIALLFRDHGDRRDRTMARLKFIVFHKGIDECRRIVLENLKNEGVSTDDLETEDFEETGVDYPDRPLLEQNPVGTDGRTTVRAMVPKGELTHIKFKRMAELSEIYGNKRVYLTNRQNIEIHGVKPEKVEAITEEIQKIGFATDGFFGLKDIVPCVGTTYCPKAVTETRSLYDTLIPVVSQAKYSEIWDKAIINITGCPNSCSPYRIADIGFRGMRIREQVGSTEAYEMRIGGNHDRLARKFGEFKHDDCPRVLEKILDTFLAVRQGDETLADCIHRLGL
ncbi:MAG: nitrite/sulfite reductase [Verrucomicrobia bacterium]|nr:nitrite/sulfite reductase [Verrucomicrobiota bacterium]